MSKHCNHCISKYCTDTCNDIVYVSSYGELIYEYVTDRYSNAYVNSTWKKRCECKEKSAFEKYEIETIHSKAYLWYKYVKIIEFKFPL